MTGRDQPPRRRLAAVGFWVEGEGRDFPHPRPLLEALGPRDYSARELAYLRGGAQFIAYLGFSACRFSCGAPEAEMGCRDLTDGVWVWPEGLAHYAEVHRVPLPPEFISALAGDLPTGLDPREFDAYEFDLEPYARWRRSVLG